MIKNFLCMEAPDWVVEQKKQAEVQSDGLHDTYDDSIAWRYCKGPAREYLGFLATIAQHYGFWYLPHGLQNRRETKTLLKRGLEVRWAVLKSLRGA